MVSCFPSNFTREGDMTLFGTCTLLFSDVNTKYRLFFIKYKFLKLKIIERFPHKNVENRTFFVGFCARVVICFLQTHPFAEKY